MKSWITSHFPPKVATATVSSRLCSAAEFSISEIRENVFTKFKAHKRYTALTKKYIYSSICRWYLYETSTVNKSQEEGLGSGEHLVVDAARGIYQYHSVEPWNAGDALVWSLTWTIDLHSVQNITIN